MANCVFGWPIYSDPIPGAATPAALSGGSWLAAYPLANVQNRRPQKAARSTDATAASTQCDVNLGAVRGSRVLAVLVLNATFAATVRWRASNVAGSFGSPIYDSTALLVRPSGQTAETLFGMNVWTTLVTPADVNAQYWRMEVNDTANPDGFVDVGRVIVAAGWQPTNNVSYGHKLGVETDTVRNTTDGGAYTYNAKPTRRRHQFTLPELGVDEAMSRGFDLQRLAGTSGQLHFVFDASDPHMFRRAFAGTLFTLSAVEYPYFNVNDLPFDFMEDL